MLKSVFVAVIIFSLLVLAPASSIAAAGIDRNARAIDARTLLAHIRKLASDEFEGRSPSSKGEALTVQYVTEQFRAAGCTPGNLSLIHI